MHCKLAAQHLQASIDGRLTWEEFCTLEMHLSHCVACRAELVQLREIDYALNHMELVAEPSYLTTTIMARVASTPQDRESTSSMYLHLSWREVLAVVVLATIATLGIIWEQPSLREVLPFANGHDMLSLAFMNASLTLGNVNTSTLNWLLWIVGTLLGVWITLALAGDEMRSQWFRAMMDRLPVW